MSRLSSHHSKSSYKRHSVKIGPTLQTFPKTGRTLRSLVCTLITFTAAGPHATSHCFRQFGIRLAVLNGEKKESMFGKGPRGPKH